MRINIRIKSFNRIENSFQDTMFSRSDREFIQRLIVMIGTFAFLSTHYEANHKSHLKILKHYNLLLY